MTIVAGFLGPRVNPAIPVPYVVLGADSEEVGNAITSSVRKIEVIDAGTYKCLLAGAGNGDFIDLAIQEVRTALQPPFTLESIRGQIEDVVTQIYVDRIDGYPAHQQDDLAFQLLGAIWTQADGTVQMIKVGRGLSLILTRPTTIGVGSDLAQYIIANFHFKDMNAHPACRLMVYLLAQCKKFVPDCGGNSQVIALDGNGQITELWPSTITQHELSASVIMDGGGKWLFYYADPMAFNYNMRALEGMLDEANRLIKQDIRTRLFNVAAAQQTAAANTSPSASISPSASPSGSLSPSPSDSISASPSPEPTDDDGSDDEG